MTIRIESIEATLINTSAGGHDDYVLKNWKVTYMIFFDAGQSHFVKGEMDWLETPDPRKILEYLRNRYKGL